MDFILIPKNKYVPDQGINKIYLKIDHWNDYSFVTMFYLSLHDENGKYHEIGNVKIGFKGQDISKDTYATLDQIFTLLPNEYFSLGDSLEYYQKIRSELTPKLSDEILSGLRDIVLITEAFEVAKEEVVFRESLLRTVSLSVINGQFKRVLKGQAALTDFKFEYRRAQEEKFAGIDLGFHVKAESKPSTNIHAVIGRNGIGKTTLLNGMIEAVTNSEGSKGQFIDKESFPQDEAINTDYFSSLISVSFSAFDSFEPPPEQPNPALGTCYYYIGLKNTASEAEESELKSLATLRNDFCDSVSLCFSQKSKKDRWLKAINTLESDENFADMQLSQLSEFSGEELKTKALRVIERMSSGHTIVILIITRLVALAEEKTFVLIDEPESHLHPPLLSALVRALSELLYDRNGVAIIATHSPVVLQEIPASCVWKVTRSRLEISCIRPEIQTFGENVGVLTREFFGLEVIKSGFHKLLQNSVDNGGSFDEISRDFSGQLGFEAQAILRAMILHRDGSGVGQ